MPEVLFHLPLPAAGALIIGCLCAYSLFGLAVTRRFVLPRLRVSGEDSEFSGAMVQAVMVFYGLAVALVAVNVWESHSEISDVFVGLVITLIVAFDRPFLGDLGLDPEPYRLIRGQLMAP